VVSAGGWVFVSGQFAANPSAGGIPPEAMVDPRSPYLGDKLVAEARYIFPNMAEALAAAGVTLDDVVFLSEWFVSEHPTAAEFARGDTWPGLSIAPYLKTRSEFMRAPRPASAATGIRRLCATGTTIELDMTALHPSLGPKEGFGEQDPDEPGYGGPSAVRRGDWVFLGGHAGVEAGQGAPASWTESSIEAQTENALHRLAALAEKAGSSLDRCVKATVYLGHPSDWYGMDGVWRRWFPESPPARLVVPYMGLGLRGSRIEISMELLARDSALGIETVETSAAPEPVGHEPQAVKAGDFVFFSTQHAVDSSGRVPEALLPQEGFPYYRLPAKLQMDWILDNVAAICEAAGTSIDQVCRRKVFHDHFEGFPSSMEAWAARFPVDPPASVAIEVGGPLLVPGSRLFLDLIAYVP
jgi:enamine deaminase RidA (YjgF/YER057c/UK114 family)